MEKTRDIGSFAPELLKELKICFLKMEHEPDCYSATSLGVCICGKERVGRLIKEVEGE